MISLTNAAVREFGFSFPSEVAASFTCVAMTAAGLMSSFTACAPKAVIAFGPRLSRSEIRPVEIVDDRFHLGVDASIPGQVSR